MRKCRKHRALPRRSRSGRTQCSTSGASLKLVTSTASSELFHQRHGTPRVDLHLASLQDGSRLGARLCIPCSKAFHSQMAKTTPSWSIAPWQTSSRRRIFPSSSRNPPRQMPLECRHVLLAPLASRQLRTLRQMLNGSIGILSKQVRLN